MEDPTLVDLALEVFTLVGLALVAFLALVALLALASFLALGEGPFNEEKAPFHEALLDTLVLLLALL